MLGSAGYAYLLSVFSCTKSQRHSSEMRALPETPKAKEKDAHCRGGMRTGCTPCAWDSCHRSVPDFLRQTLDQDLLADGACLFPLDPERLPQIHGTRNCLLGFGRSTGLVGAHSRPGGGGGGSGPRLRQACESFRIKRVGHKACTKKSDQRRMYKAPLNFEVLSGALWGAPAGWTRETEG